MDGVELLRIESERPAEGPVVRIQQIGVVRRTENRLPEGCGVPAEAPVRLAEEFTCPEYPAAVDGNRGGSPEMVVRSGSPGLGRRLGLSGAVAFLLTGDASRIVPVGGGKFPVARRRRGSASGAAL